MKDPSDAENSELKAMATKISLHVSLPDSGSFENGQQVAMCEIQAKFRMTRFMEKMLFISSQSPGGNTVSIQPEEVTGNRQTMKFKASVTQGTMVEVKVGREHVAGSPFTYHVSAAALPGLSPPIDQATASLGRLTMKEVLPTASEPSASSPMVVDLSSDSSSLASSPGIDFSAGIRWKEVGSVDAMELGGQVGLCLLKNGSFVVSTMNNVVKMYDPQLRVIKTILDKDGREFRGPGDMTLLYNGDFAMKDRSGIQIFNPRGLFESRVWTNRYPWQCWGLAEDDSRQLWFLDVNKLTHETHLMCYDLKKRKPVTGISLKQLVGDRHEESKCRFLTFFKGKLYLTDLGLNQGFIVDPNDFESVVSFGSRGAGQLNYPAGIAVDDVGNILVADCRNNRLGLFDKNGQFIQNHQAGVNVVKPNVVLLDRERKELYCLNLGGPKAVVKYSL